MNRRIMGVLVAFVATMLLAACSGPAQSGELEPARDLASDSEKGAPIIVIFVGHPCPYCEYVEERHLVPMQRRVDAGEEDKVVIRVVEISDDRTLIDFSGEEITVSSFVERHNGRFTPTLLFFGPDGEQHAEPLVGVSSEDYYGGYLEDRLAQVRETLH